MPNTSKFTVKNGLQTQNISFVSPNESNTITTSLLDSDTLSFAGNSGQLFSITDSLTGTIFAVNDVSGVPSIEVDDTGVIRLAESFGNVLIGTATDDGINKLQVNGAIKISSTTASSSTATGALIVAGGAGIAGNLYVGGTINGTFGGTISGSYGSQTANTVLAAPNGTAGTPTFRTLVVADFPTLNQNTTGTASNITSTTLASVVTASSLTSVGALTSLTVTGDTTIGGNLTVNGTTTTINSNTLTVDDKNIELGSVANSTISASGTVGTISGTGPWTAVITGMTATTGLIIGSTISATAGTGTLYGGTPTSCLVTGLTSTSVNYTVTGGTAPTAGTISAISTTSANNTTADGGGITLKGTTDKTFNWVNSTGAWTSSEHINLASGKYLYFNGVSLSAHTTAQLTMNGGGIVTWSGTRLLWDKRVIVIPVEALEYGSAGYFDINCPTSGTIAYYSSTGTTTLTCTAAGIPLSSWDALYYKIPIGANQGSSPSNFVVVNYSNTTWSPDPSWLLLATVNGDGTNIGHVKWLPGQVNLPHNGSTVTYNTGTGISSWGGTGPIGPNNWTPVVTGVTQSTTDAQTFTKTGTTTAWDAQVYSVQGFVRGAFATAKAASTATHIMFGLNSDPSTDSSYNSIDYALYFNGGSVGIYESNVDQTITAATYTTSDLFSIIYDGYYVRYYQNSTLLRSVARTMGNALYFDSSFYEQNAALNSVTFGPMGEAATFGSQTANTFFAAPNGTAGVPSFRAIVNADIPSSLTLSGTLSLSSTSSNVLNIGTSSSLNSFPVSQTGAALGGTLGNQSLLTTLSAASSNIDSLEISATRYTTGTTWTTAGMRLQQRVDSTWMAYIQFNGAAQSGITFGSGSSTSGATGVTGRIVLDSSGNLYPIADNTYTLGGSSNRWSTIYADQIHSSSNGSGTNFKIGDDAWIGDINVTNTFRVTGQADGTAGYIVFGNSNTKALGRTGTGALTYDGNAVLTTANSTYVGTTQISLSRASAAQVLTGITSIDGAAAFLRQTDGTSILTTVQAITTSGSRTGDLAPSTYQFGLFSEFKSSSTYSSTGNYSGLITYANYQGTTSSTGDPSYQLLFSPAAINSTAAPTLKIRAGIDSTWGPWSTFLHSGNLANYSTYVGTTQIALNRTSANQALTGINSIGTLSTINLAQSLTLNTSTVNGGTLSVDGTVGQLFSVSNSLTGTLFSVNDISGMPSIEVLDTGVVRLAQYSGNVLIGTATDDGVNKLQVSGSVYVIGELKITGNITAWLSSDKKFKENIKNVDGALEKVVAIGSKSFSWSDSYIKDQGGEDGYFIKKDDFGVIAQDVQAVFPTAVKEREDGSLAVDYQKLGILSFGAIAELLKRIEILESKLGE